MPALTPVEQQVAIQLAAHEQKAVISANPSLTSDQKPVVEAMADFVNAKQGEEALKTVATEFIHGTHVSDVIKHFIFTDIDAAGNPKARSGTSEAADETSCENKMKLLQDYLLKGYDNIGAGGGLNQAQRQAALRDEVRSLLMSIPAFYDALKDSSGVITDATCEQLLRDRFIMNQLATSLNEAFDPAKLTGELQKKLLEARAKKTKANSEIARLTVEKASSDAAFVAAQDKKNDFESAAYASTSGTAGGNRKDVLKNLQTNHLVQEYITKKQRYDILQAKIASGQSLTGAEATEAAAIRPRVLALEADPHIIEYKGLSLLEKTIYNEYEEAERKKVEIEGKLAAAKLEQTAAKNEENNITLQLKTRSSEFNLAIQNALQRAIITKMYERVNDNIAKYPEYRKQALTALEEKRRNQINQYLDQRWKEKDRSLLRPREERVRLNSEQAKKDYRLLLQQGPDALIKEILTGAGIPNNEVEVLLNDEDFMKTQRKDLPVKVLSVYVASGGRFSEKELQVIATSSWGEGALTDLFTKNDKVKKLIQDGKDKGIWQGSVKEILSKLGWGKFVLLILIALGLVSVGTGLIKLPVP